MDYILSTSSTSDLDLETMQKRNIEYIPFTYIIDGKEYPDDLGQTMSHKEFYRRIREDKILPTTSQINTQTFVERFRPHLKEGKPIIHVELTSGISGAYQSLMMAKEILLEEFPESELYFHNSYSASGGLGLLMILLADMRDEGKSAKELDEWLHENKKNIHHWFAPADLEHLKRGGRVSGAAAAMGTLLGITPVLTVDKEGKLAVVEKIRGKKKVIQRLIDRVEESAAHGKDYDSKIIIGHSDRKEDAEFIADRLMEVFPKMKERPMVYNIGSVIGSHVGSGTLTICFMSKGREI